MPSLIFFNSLPFHLFCAIAVLIEGHAHPYLIVVNSEISLSHCGAENSKGWCF